MTDSLVTLAVENSIATITLNRPDKRNAMSDDMRTVFIHALESVSADKAIKALVLTGAGKGFCAGGDIEGMKRRLASPAGDVAYNGWHRQQRVHPDDPDVPVIEYRLNDELLDRRAVFRRAIRKKLGRARTLLLGFGPDLNFGHSCGTLRFGTDPRTSVLDASCKAHDLDNLYVADGSFLPTSMGVNPGLTIAANALRVADVIAARHQAERREAV